MGQFRTIYTVIETDGTETELEDYCDQFPGFAWIGKTVRPHLEKFADFEHVNVLHQGNYVDMFVDDESMAKGLPRNEKATAIYRNNVMSHRPGTDPESLPFIAGPAVLFHRKIWN